MSAPPTVAFCFHDPHPTGASLWLREFLLSHAWPEERTLAVLPTESPLEEQLAAGNVPTARAGLLMGDLKGARGLDFFRMAANRFAAVGHYQKLFRARGIGGVYVNSSYQIAPMIAAGLERLPLLVHIHEGWISGRTHGLKRWIIRRNARVVLCAAGAGREFFGPPALGQTWEVSPNGVDPALATVRELRDRARSTLGIDSNQQLVLFLGSLSRRKGFHDLLTVWPSIHQQFPGARLHVGGVVDSFETDDSIRAFPDSSPEGARFLGFARNVPQLLAAADFLILPSYAEAMPISVSEAMMAGCPVIARAVADVPWQIGEGRGFLFQGDGPEPLRSALQDALAHPEDARLRAEKAQAFAREHLTRAQQQAQVVRLIGKALEASPR